MRTIVLLAAAAICAAVNVQAMTPDQFRAHADTVIDMMAQFDPVWATNTGIHNYDDRLADFSAGNIKRFVTYLQAEEKYLAAIDTSGWPIDDKIDHRLLTANIKNLRFQYGDFPYWKKSPTLYADQCLLGIYYLVLRDFASDEAKVNPLLGRLRDIPKVLQAGKENLSDPVAIFAETSIEEVDEGIKLVSDVSESFAAKFPSRKAEFDSARDQAVAAMKDFNAFIQKLKVKARGKFEIGKKHMQFLVSDVNLIAIELDSLQRLGENIYAWSDSLIKDNESKIPARDKVARFPLPSLDKNDVLSYYQWEVNAMRDWVTEKEIATLPDNFGRCIPVETPEFLRGIIRGIAYEPPAVLDSIKTGYFYVRPLPDTFSTEQRANYLDYFYNRGFKGSVVHEAFPGHHMQLLLGQRHPSKIRRIQQSNFLAEGWALYCEQMAYESGLYGDENLRQWNGVLGGIRFRAVRIIVDIGLQTGRFTPETALQFMNEKLGESTYYFTAEIRRYCAYPTQAMSYLVGKTMLLALRERAKQQDGVNFTLKAFHDKLLSEGTISPSLIAEKYNW